MPAFRRCPCHRAYCHQSSSSLLYLGHVQFILNTRKASFVFWPPTCSGCFQLAVPLKIAKAVVVAGARRPTQSVALRERFAFLDVLCIPVRFVPRRDVGVVHLVGESEI